MRWGGCLADANAVPVQGGQEWQDQQAEDECARHHAAARCKAHAAGVNGSVVRWVVPVLCVVRANCALCLSVPVRAGAPVFSTLTKRCAPLANWVTNTPTLTRTTRFSFSWCPKGPATTAVTAALIVRLAGRLAVGKVAKHADTHASNTPRQRPEAQYIILINNNNNKIRAPDYRASECVCVPSTGAGDHTTPRPTQ